MKPKLGQIEFISLMALLTALTAMSIDAILPALMDIRRDLELADANSTQLVVTLFVLGMVFGEIIFGPLADAFGRKRMIQLGLALYGIGILMAVSAQTLEWVLLGRVLQGFGVAAPKVVTRAIVRDMYSGNAMARIMSLVMSIMILTPMLAPLVGQTVLLAGTWRWVFGLFFIHALISAIWFGIRQPETLDKADRIPLNLPALLRNARAIVGNGRVMYATLAAGLLFGSILCYVSMAQDVFVDLYDKGVWFPLWFGALALPGSLSSLVNARFVEKYGMETLTNLGFWGITISSSLLVLAAFIYDGVPPFWMFFLLCFLNASCFGSVFGNINSIAMEWLGRVAGLGSAIIASLSSLVAVAVSVPIGRFYDGTIMPVAIAYLLAGIGGVWCLRMIKRTKGVEV